VWGRSATSQLTAAGYGCLVGRREGERLQIQAWLEPESPECVASCNRHPLGGPFLLSCRIQRARTTTQITGRSCRHRETVAVGGRLGVGHFTFLDGDYPA